MIWKILSAFLLAPVAVVLISRAQTSQDPCPSGTPKCYSDLAPYAVKTLELSYKFSKRQDQYGNNFRYRAKIMDLQGAQFGRWAWDVFLLRAP